MIFYTFRISHQPNIKLLGQITFVLFDFIYVLAFQQQGVEMRLAKSINKIISLLDLLVGPRSRDIDFPRIEENNLD